ncbi:phosphatase PAP2 family protein [Gilliamella sp. B2776]|uniref:phosphatase PAP2 family protein n=1 Tax=unclassified Gilliamella TaxID=2685620 RepID=UPI00226A91CB|nr:MULTISPECIES: phosphatase PAP2 family protein [unclassified Gilliamella]MCX8650639.1 phosphatase PAP2 family protein [Gilliamella sp. B2779]MCX8654418.1 phosphatase PAP2 family protein [Gilliamella sp. B2737]MCX8657015.1 phosphatase PAP2 family protein [Gilliamella sp. B2894]MCX8665734.1 phosphatase PAP2 family protein [Gilliamella sp. B2887]MCX8692496.1 phosphatase PAP2 family protein [Gilliamella sp. B2776]
MGFVIKKTMATLAIMLIIPLVIIAINWHWQPESLNDTSKYFFYITETASFPWAMMTSTVFFIIFCCLLTNKTIKKMIALWFCLVCAILGGQIVKTIIKSQTAESRPYVLWMTKEFHLSDKQFYLLPKSEKQQFISEKLNNSKIIPNWLSKHWQSETGYSLPSGHTLFSATWAFLAITLLGFRRHYIIVTAIIVWALLIEISRLALGMHSPIDLLLGILLAWAISLICYFYSQKWHIVER